MELLFNRQLQEKGKKLRGIQDTSQRAAPVVRKGLQVQFSRLDPMSPRVLSSQECPLGEWQTQAVVESNSIRSILVSRPVASLKSLDLAIS